MECGADLWFQFALWWNIGRGNRLARICPASAFGKIQPFAGQFLSWSRVGALASADRYSIWIWFDRSRRRHRAVVVDMAGNDNFHVVLSPLKALLARSFHASYLSQHTS